MFCRYGVSFLAVLAGVGLCASVADEGKVLNVSAIATVSTSGISVAAQGVPEAVEPPSLVHAPANAGVLTPRALRPLMADETVAVQRIASAGQAVTTAGDTIYIETAGAEPLEVSVKDFWSLSASGDEHVSTQISHDERSDRWVISAILRRSERTVLAYAISRTSDARAEWRAYDLPLNPVPPSALPPAVSFSNQQIVINAYTADGEALYTATRAARDGNSSTGHESAKVMGKAAAAVAFAPLTTGVTPSSGTGRQQAFTASFYDADGAASITQAMILIAPALDGRNACFITLQGAQIGLLSDTNASTTFVTPSTSQTASNSQCTLRGEGSSIYRQDGLLKITAVVQFHTNFGGAKSVYLYAADSTGLYSGWQVKGLWTVPTMNRAPSVAMSDFQTTSSAVGIRLEASDLDGVQDLTQVSALINSSLNGAGACYIVFNLQTKQIGLVNDSGSGTTYTTVGASTVLENSRCTVNAQNASISVDNYYGRVWMYVSANLKGASSTQSLYLHALDSANTGSGWMFVRSFPPPASPAQSAPSASIGTIDVRSGRTAQINATFQDTAGANTIRTAAILINTALNGAGACYVTYSPAAAQIALVNDAGTAPIAYVNTPIENSQCKLETASVSTNVETITLSLSVTFKRTFGGTKVTYAYADDTSGLTTGWQLKQVITLPTIANAPPLIDSLTFEKSSPASGMLYLNISDADGKEDIQSASILVSSSLIGTNACYVTWQKSTDQLGLINDTGTSTMYVTPNQVGTAENSQCIIDGAASSVSNDYYYASLRIAVRIRFKAAFSGTKFFYASATDALGDSSGWQQRMQNTFPTSSTPPTMRGYSLYSYGANFDISVTATDFEGADTLKTVALTYNTALSDANGCVMTYDAVNGRLGLANDAGTSISWIALNTSQQTSNSQCTLYASGAYAYVSGSDLNLRLRASFTSSFQSTPKQVYGMATDIDNQSSGWQKVGDHATTASALTPPVMTISPTSGTGGIAFLQLSITAPSGNATDVRDASLLVNTTLNGAGACYVIYQFATSTLRLVGDNGTGGQTSQTGVTGSLSNSQCSIDTSKSTLESTHNGYRLNLALAFTRTFTGTKNIYLNGSSTNNLSTNWYSSGAWTIPQGNFPPVPVGLEFYSYSSSGSLNATFSDLNGGATITNAQVLINSALDGQNSCYIIFSGNRVGLVNDAATSVTYLATSSTAKVENSQCSISYGNSSGITVQGSDVRLYLSIQIKPSFSGSKYVYMNAFDDTGLTSEWQIKGSWAMPLPYGE